MKTLHGIIALVISLTLTGAATAQSPDGLIAIKSASNTKDTMNKVEDIVKQRQLKVFARVDHSAGAKSIGKTLRPTELIIFGNPQGGTPFMECAQSVGIDLPLKMLVWEDASGQTWVGYNDPAYLAKRHQATACPAVSNIGKALESLAAEAAK